MIANSQGRQRFAGNVASAYSPTVNLFSDGNGTTTSTIAAVGENPSAKRRLPNYSLLTINYSLTTNLIFT
jgi:hypothetical protein